MGPKTVEPSAYPILKVPLFFELVDEAEEEYLCFDAQAELVQLELGIQRSDEPVSKSIKNFWAGVPIEIVPAHSLLSSSVRASLCLFS